MEKDLEHIRGIINETHRPLVFFDDDPDGMTSFVMLYRHIREGKGVIVKSKPVLDQSFARTVIEYSPDTVFVLDKPDISEEFIEKANTRIVWIDHHPPVKRSRVVYFNPRVYDDKDIRATSYWIYRLVQKDLWLAAAGVVADWQFIPEILVPFREKYPDLLPKAIKAPDKALYESKIGFLARILSFNLKGSTKEALASVKVLTRIESPYEILNQETSKGKFIYRRYEKYDKLYQDLLRRIKPGRDKLAVFRYEEDKTSFSADLSNELTYKHPNKVFIIARRKSGEMKCSIRGGKVKVPPLIEAGLRGVQGYGGGHDYACGACIKEEDFGRFVKQFRAAMK